MDPLQRYAAFVTGRRKLVIALFLLATLLVGSGAPNVDNSLSIAQFEADSAEADAFEELGDRFDTGPDNRTALQVVVRGDDVLSKDSLLTTLRYQQALRANATVNATLVDEQPVADFATLVATAAAGGEGPPGQPPSIERQIEIIESMSEEEVRSAVDRVLEAGEAGNGQSPYAFLPTDFSESSGTADARVLLVFQTTEGDAAEDPSAALVDAQLAAESLAQEAVGADGEAFAFGTGIVSAESTNATGDSFTIIGPLALVLILLVLAIAYRDVLDVALGMLGILLVLVWMQGFMGWVGIDMTQILIAVPFLLVGLSIDYALHVVMRYREASTDGPDVATAMERGLSAVVLAIAAATVTTSVGFASNLVSPIPPIRDFGLVSAVGILAAFVVFGLFLPALKVSLDGALARWRDWRKPAFGVDTPAVSGVLGAGARAARRAPIVIVVIAILLAAGGAYGAANTDTTFSQEEFLPTDTPGWMASLPGPFAPADYDIKSNAAFLNDRFARFGDAARTEVLVEGPVATPAALDRVSEARGVAREANSTLVLASGDASVDDPLAAIAAVAARNDTVAAALAESDEDGDGVPDRNVESVLDAAFAAAPDRMDDVVARDDGEYTAFRLSTAIRGGVPPAEAAADARASAAAINGTTVEGEQLQAIATGQPVLTAIVQDGLLRTLVEAFLITLVVIGAFLAALYRWRHGTATLGLLTLVPVVAALAWLLGSMYLLGLKFTTETAVITSIAIGLGVDYSIHVSERFVHEQAQTADLGTALDRTISGTGGALLGSAATTTAGFGVLALALVPSLQRFGIVTALTIVYAFLASILVLPSVLVLWTRVTDRE